MTPHTAEMLQLVVPLLVAALGGPPAIRRGLAWWAAYREQRAKAREQIELTHATGDASIARLIIERMDRSDAACEQRLAEAEKRCDEKLEARTTELRHELADTRRDLATVARRARDGRDADTTGVHELQAIEERATRSPLPPPRRRKDNDDG